MNCDHLECNQIAMSGYGRAGYYNMGYRYCIECRYYTLESIDNCPGCNKPYRLNPIYEPKANDVQLERGGKTVAPIKQIQ